MAFFGLAIEPRFWVIPAFGFLVVAGARDDAVRRERDRVWRLVVWNWLAAMVALLIYQVATANRGIMDVVRWKRVPLRGLVLLIAGLRTASCFIVLDSVAHILLRGAGSESSAAVSAACAVVAVALNLRDGCAAVFGV